MRINLELSDRKVDVVEEGFDVVLRIGQLKSSSLIAKKIAPIRLVLCAAPDYVQRNGMPNTPSDLPAEHFLRYSYMEYSINQSPLMEVLKKHSQTSIAAMVANNGQLLMEAAIAGEGYAFQPTFIVGEALQQGRLLRLLPEYEPEALGLYAVYPHRKLLAPKLQAFIEYLGGYFSDFPYWDQFD